MIQKKLKWAKDKYDVISGALDVLNGNVNILSDEAKVSMKALWCVNNKFLNNKGVGTKEAMKKAFKYASSFENQKKVDSKRGWDSFLTSFVDLYTDPKRGSLLKEKMSF